MHRRNNSQIIHRLTCLKIHSIKSNLVDLKMIEYYKGETSKNKNHFRFKKSNVAWDNYKEIQILLWNNNNLLSHKSMMIRSILF